MEEEEEETLKLFPRCLKGWRGWMEPRRTTGKKRTPREVFQRCVATRCNYLAKAYPAVGLAVLRPVRCKICFNAINPPRNWVASVNEKFSRREGRGGRERGKPFLHFYSPPSFLLFSRTIFPSLEQFLSVCCLTSVTLLTFEKLQSYFEFFRIYTNK